MMTSMIGLFGFMDGPLIIPVIAIAFGCSIPVIAIITEYRKRKVILELTYRERLAAIEKGMEPPPIPSGLLNDAEGCSRRRKHPHRVFLTGLIWTGIGLSAMLALWVAEGRDAAVYASIPASIGIAYLIYYFTVGRKEVEDWEKRETNPSLKG